ncbi:ComEA family DNA-binding protein [Micromonospora sp. NPDC002296]|uniref:ComEA family DNA-binding protein n=1 Tax=Micromonospora sp. NPDC002296 TaxID=3154271 RepID=UPI00332D38E4
MSDDEETVVRRLRWLVTDPAPAEAPEPPIVPIGSAAPPEAAVERPGVSAPLLGRVPVGGPAAGRPAVALPEDRWLPAGVPAVERPVPWPGEGRPGSGRRAARAAASSPVGGSFRGDAPEHPGEPAPSADAGSEDEPTRSPRPSRLPGPGAFDPGRRGVRALAVVAVLVVIGAGFWAWQSRPQAEPVGSAPSVAPGSEGPEEVQPVAGGPTPGGELVVAVAGKVRRPGLVRLPAGSRVADAVQAAGGALPGVDVALLNPARKVTDGELILVGVPAPAGQPGAAPDAPGGDPAVAGGRINLNTATLAQLDGLPGVGPVLAQRILAHRDQHGGFRSVGDLRQVEGIGDARYEQLKELVTV